jgi:predicted GNAT family acetyltransferase
VPGSELIIQAPLAYRPLLAAHLNISREETLHLLALELGRFEPIINVLVTQSSSYNELPRFIIRYSEGEASTGTETLASAGINWQSPRFSEVYVNTSAAHRRLGYGRSVLSAVVQSVLDSGRRPLYVVGAGNTASIGLAESLGFRDTGRQQVLLEGAWRSNP